MSIGAVLGEWGVMIYFLLGVLVGTFIMSSVGEWQLKRIKRRINELQEEIRETEEEWTCCCGEVNKKMIENWNCSCGRSYFTQ